MTRIFLGLALTLVSSTAIAAGVAFFPADARRGETLSQTCLACHGVENMKPGSPAFHVPKLKGQRPSSVFYALRDYKSGARASDIMGPMVASLSEQDMRDVSAYLAGPPPTLPPETTMTGTWAHDKVHKDCTACHGESGMGTMPGYPVIAGQHEDYLIHALKAYKDGTRTNSTMGPIAKGLNDDQLAQLAKYFAAQDHLELAK